MITGGIKICQDNSLLFGVLIKNNFSEGIALHFQAVFFLKLCASANNPVSVASLPSPLNINRLK